MYIMRSGPVINTTLNTVKRRGPVKRMCTTQKRSMAQEPHAIPKVKKNRAQGHVIKSAGESEFLPIMPIIPTLFAG